MKFLLIFLFLIQFINLYSQVDTSYKFTNLDAVEFYIKLNSVADKIILDVREYKEFRKERIPGAISVSNKQLLDKIKDTLDKEIPLFLYCDDISRSLTVCEFLHENEFLNIFILEDGILGWKEMKLPMDKKKLKKIKAQK